MRRRGGPTPYARLDLAVKVDQGARVHQLHRSGHTFAEIATLTGWSKTTCWRRCRWLEDWTLPATAGLPVRRIPPQRSTAACPRGRPCVAEMDHPELRTRPQRCGARRKSDGEDCRNWARRGQRVCRMHGGSSPQARRAAARRLEAERERRALGYRMHEHC